MNHHKEKFISWSIVTLLAIFAFIIAYWQSGQIWPMIDYAYQMDHAYRIYLGEIPFKDFGLVLMPGTYWTIALLMKLFGVSNMVQVYYTCSVAALSILITFFILNRIAPSYYLNLILVTPLIFTGHAHYAFPSYDINATFWMLVSLAFLLGVIEKDRGKLWYLITGCFLAIPILFKQNTGLLFYCTNIILLLTWSFFSKNKILQSKIFCLILGSFLIMGGFLAWIFLKSDWASFYFHTFAFAKQTRSPFQTMLHVLGSYAYQEAVYCYLLGGTIFIFGLVIKSIWIKRILMPLFIICGLALFPCMLLIEKMGTLSLFFIYGSWLPYNNVLWNLIVLLLIGTTIFELLIKKKTGSFLSWLPICILFTVNASFLSQGILGSTYGIWPFFFIMLALAIKLCPQSKDHKLIYTIITPLSLLLVVSLAIYTWYNLRLILYVEHEGPQQSASPHDALKGLSTPGPWIPNFEGLLEFVKKEIPATDKILTVPGEDPFYTFTNRCPPLPYIQINKYTFPNPAEWMILQAIKQNVIWVIVKEELQTTSGYKDLSKLMTILKENYSIFKKLSGYTIYKINSSPNHP